MKYEDFVGNPAGEMGRICAFLDETYSEDALVVEEHEKFKWKPDPHLSADIVKKTERKWQDHLSLEDAGKIEAEAAAKAGANVMTVLGAADEATIRECVEAGQHYGLGVAVDLLGVDDPVGFAKDAAALGVAWLGAPGSLFAAMDMPIPLPQIRMPLSAWPSETAVATSEANTG